MTGQLPLIPKPLTARQQVAYDLVRTTPGGITAEEVGAALHEQRGRHAASDTCLYCPSEGLSVLRSKAVAPLVIRRRLSGRYEPRDKKHARSLVEAGATTNESAGLPGETWEDIFDGSEAA